ncbi:MAG: beta-galactosidase [Phycisphaeraceae bacterium]
MPTVSYDSQSFSIDGRRVWLVSGSVHYARIPQKSWRDRIKAAKQAGLNCIETPVFWNAHEKSPGEFNFSGDLDLKLFVQTVAREGLYCILRPGPYVGSSWDFGGLPAYLHGVEDRKGQRVKFREDEPQFLEAVDRYFRAVMEQVGDLQIASLGSSGSASYAYPPGSAAGGYQGEGGGPIVLMQVEHAWESHDPEQPYLERLVSMMRQHGCLVPIVNNNNLWQPVEGTIDTWRGATDLPAIVRQLSSIQPESPAMVMDFVVGSVDTWSREASATLDADTLAYRAAGLMGVGAQLNLSPFHSGTNLGFGGGGLTRPGSAHAVTDAGRHAPLGSAGERGEAYAAIKRLATFASQFGTLLANSDNAPAPTVALNEVDHATALLHRRSSQGELIVLLKSEKDKSRHTSIMLASGLSLLVPHAGQRVAWVLVDASLGGVGTLDYTSLSPWALIDRKLLVVFGPAGASGVISIDGEHREIAVPTGKTPTVIQGDPFHLAILNHEQIDAAYRSSEGLVIGCDGLDADDKPLPLKGWGTQFLVTPDGEVSRKRIAPPATYHAPKLGGWKAWSVRTLIDGSDDAYRPIEGPASLGELGQAAGYGWYRLTNAQPGSGKVLLHTGGDRLHVYQNGKLASLLGRGDGADDEPKQLKFTKQTVILADALGRASDGQAVGGDPKGLPDHLYFVKPIKPGKPVITKRPAGDPFSVVGMAMHQRAQTRPISESVAWTVKPEQRKPILLDIAGLPQPCVVSVNDEPIAFYAAEHHGLRLRQLLDPAALEPMTGGKNAIKLELLEPLIEATDLAKHVRFYQTTGAATPKDGWAFTPWTIPAFADEAWRPVPKNLPSQPSWLGCSFEIESTDPPLYLEPRGMSKGQIVLNGHNVGRYWQQTREGKIVGPQDRYLLPQAWLDADRPNTLMLFDEHGRTPEKVKLVYV